MYGAILSEICTLSKNSPEINEVQKNSASKEVSRYGLIQAVSGILHIIHDLISFPECAQETESLTLGIVFIISLTQITVP